MDDFLDTFFAGCDESTMATLIALFEEGDEQKLREFVNGVSDDDTKQRLLAGLEQLNQFKSMDADID